MAKSPQEMGKWFEQQLSGRAKRPFPAPLDLHRFLDAASCGNTGVPKAPADFEIAYQGSVYLIECKASTRHESLRSMFGSAVKDHQVDALKRRQLTGNPGFILFYSELTDEVQFWPQSTIINARYGGKRLPKDPPLDFMLRDLTNGQALLDCFDLADQDLEDFLNGEIK